MLRQTVFSGRYAMWPWKRVFVIQIKRFHCKVHTKAEETVEH